MKNENTIEKNTLPFKKLLNVIQVANLLNVKPWTIRAWVSQKKIPYVKVGRLVRFRPEDIEAFIQANCIESHVFWENETKVN